MNYLSSGRKSAPQQASAPAAQPAQTVQAAAAPRPEPVKETPVQKPAVSVGGNDEIIEMDRMRKLIADHMVMSKRTSPHVTSFVEADVTNIVNWRNKVKNEFERKYGEKITFTPIFMEAVVQAIREFPGVNASVDGDRIIIRKNINLGMATALPSGNLIVPVIKNADMMNLAGLSKSVNDLANRARIGKLQPDEISGGTYTLTNVGSFGIDTAFAPFFPLARCPMVILVPEIRRRPWVVGEEVLPRPVLRLCATFDHRIIDGYHAGLIARDLRSMLEDPATLDAPPR